MWYVSPNQLNLQVPYEVTAGTAATLVINNNGQLASVTFRVGTSAPAIFTDQNKALVPNHSAVRGQTLTLYITGAGLVYPAIATGAAPAANATISQLPAPEQAATVTIGNVAAPTTFAGIPAGVVGVIQINCQVPSTVTTGTQPVVVTIGGISSAAATLAVIP